MLVSQCQPSVQGVLANDQPVLVCHYHAPEADVALLTFVHSLAHLHVLFQQAVPIVQPKVHVAQALLQTFLLQNGSEGFLALIDETGDELCVLGEAPA